MNMETISLIHVELFIIICLIFVYIVYTFIHNNHKTNHEDLNLFYLRLLELAISNYKVEVYDTKLSKLKNAHDLDQESQFNARDQFKRREIALLKESIDELLRLYLHPNVLRHIKKHIFTDEALLLFISNSLKENMVKKS